MNIKRELRKLLLEAEYTYHAGNLDHDKLKPHFSDQAFNMGTGRDTGHFGSGTYFSTYDYIGNDEKDKLSNKYGDRHKPQNGGLIKVAKGDKSHIYRVDMDLYKNLYRVKSEKHGTFLFKTMKRMNEMMLGVVEEYGQGKIKPNYAPRWVLATYKGIAKNCGYIGLKLPPLREFLQMLIEVCEDLKENGGFHYKNQNMDRNIPSLSTRVMEYNGFNGVNVSGIEMYDNTLHGSVIYDLNKVSSDIKKVETNYDFSHEIENDVIGNGLDTMEEYRRGKEIDFRSFSQLNVAHQNEILKGCGFYFQERDVRKLPTVQQRRYFHNLVRKLWDGDMSEFPPQYVLEWLVDNDHFDVITQPTYEKQHGFGDKKTFLHYFLYNYEDFLPKEKFEKLSASINRELLDYEQPLYQEWLEDY